MWSETLFIVCMRYGFFIHLSANGYLGWFSNLVSRYFHNQLTFVCEGGRVLRSSMTRSHVSLPCLLRSLQIDFHSRNQQKGIKAPFPCLQATFAVTFCSGLLWLLFPSAKIFTKLHMLFTARVFEANKSPFPVIT